MADAESFTVSLKWAAPDGSLPVVVNHFAIQPGMDTAGAGTPDMLYLMFGHAMPPVVDEPIDREQLAKVLGQGIEVARVGSFAFTKQRLAQLRDAISQMLEQVN